LQAFEIEIGNGSEIGPKVTHELANPQLGGSFNLNYTCRDHQNYLWTKRQHEMAYGQARSMLYWICISIFYYCIFMRFFVYSPPPVHVYIQSFDPQINTSVIHNMVEPRQVHVEQVL
jgi:hypothetical protein